MSKEQVKNSVYQGKLVECDAKLYPDVRRWLHEIAGEFADAQDTVRMNIALMEVKRLDAQFAETGNA